VGLNQNLAVHFSEAEFGLAATWTPAAGGAASSISILFDNGYEDYEFGTVEHSGRAPAAMVQSSEVAGLVVGDTLTIEGVDYRVRTIEPDGQGVTRLVLHA